MSVHFCVRTNLVGMAAAALALTASWACAQSGPFTAYKTVPAAQPFSSVPAESIAKSPLATDPYVFRLHHLSAGAMSAGDKEALREHWPALVNRARLFQFDLASSGWNYRQTVCPAFPNYLFLSFEHGPDPDGSSRFVAVFEKDQPEVQLIPSFAHGARPFQGSWRKGTYRVFNRMLRQVRGRQPISAAANWLVIGMCYAELSGFPVQVVTPRPIPGSMLDVLRLKAGQPQMRAFPDHSAEITFSDIARPLVTANWVLRFNPDGQITFAERNVERQPTSIALKP